MFARRHVSSFALTAALVVGACSSASAGEPAPEPPPARGLGLVSADGVDSLFVHWLVQGDYHTFLGDKPPGTEPRGSFAVGFAGLMLDATVHRLFHSAMLVDFADGRLKVLLAFVEARIHPAFVVRVGKFPTPISQERMTPEIELPWVSFSPASLALPGSEIGVQIYGEPVERVLRYNLALANGNAAGRVTESDPDTGKDVVGRIFVQPFGTTGGRAIEKLGLGVGASAGLHRGTAESPLTPLLRTYGGKTWFSLRGAPPNVVLADGEVTRIVPHVVWSAGPVGAFADWVHERSKNGDTTLRVDALSASATVALTGETIEPFARMPVARPIDPARGWFGAAQLVAGVGRTQIGASAFPLLADPAASMRRSTVVGGGANWYPTRGIGILVDYSHVLFDAALGAPPRPDENAINARFEMVL